MLAVRLERNVLQQHDLVIAADLLEGAAEMDGGILLVALGIFLPGTSNAARRVEQPFAVWVVPCPANQRTYRVRHIVGDVAGGRRLDEIAVVGIAMIIAHPLSSR